MKKRDSLPINGAARRAGFSRSVRSFFTRLFAPLNRLGIRGRTFIYFLVFTAALLALLWVFQIALLPSFYQLKKSQMLTATVNTLVQNIDNPDLQLLADRLSEANDVTVLILNDQGENLITSTIPRNSDAQRMMGIDLSHYIGQAKGQTSTIYQTYSNNMDGMPMNGYDENRFSGPVPAANHGLARSMIAVRQVNTQDGTTRYIFLNTQITPVEATVHTLSSQYLFIAGFMVLLSFILSLVLSRRIAQPIIDTSEAAVELSEGRFQPAVTSVSYREIRDLNQTLTKAAKDLRRVENMQRELIANISHDLRTPLTLIEGYAEAMRDLPGENTPENMQVIIEETRRLTSLVNTVLEYSAGKNGMFNIEPAEYSLTLSIRRILTRYRKLTEQDGYHILFQYDREVTVNADEMKLEQVVYNLVNNALTYTGDDKTVLITQNVSDGIVRLSVKDTGEGISPEELPYIWDRYYRGQKPHKRAAVGTGLGLSIVKGILDAHRLRYGVESAVETGTTFWFELPVTSEAILPEKDPTDET